MNILIIGCGKVGAGLANSLYKKGHDVAVVDNHRDSFSRLDDGFTGFAVTGVPIDLDTLQKAGIEGCDFVAAVTDDDNTNVMVSQLAKEFFNVPKVLTRIYDPQRKDVFAQFGLHTISPTALTVDIIERIISSQSDIPTRQFVFGSTALSIDSLPVPKAYYGVPIADVDHDSTETIIGVQQKDGSMILRDTGAEYCLQQGDQLIFAKMV
ncbi:MAG: TrkA family potassium uptake protein [Angelakisella sp.]